MESSKMVQSLIGLRTLSQNWFRHFVAFQWNESDLCWLWCWFMRWDNLLLVKYSDLHTLSNVSTWSRFTHFLVFWLDLAIYALCRILMKCRDLRIFPGTNYRFPGTKNFSTPLLGKPSKKKTDILRSGIVGKKWEPRNPVPGPFSAKIRKVNQNSESRREFGK